ncbi:MAG: MarR family transcriptional regulator [Deltaproteobacteria bacterium]|nr:MarR family transcriptional regulator [Deltaproteobacteria bacterium]
MAPSVDELEILKRASLGQVLFRAARLYNELAVARVRKVFPAFKLAHTQLLPHLSHEGIRLTELARRVGTSKQAIAPLVEELVTAGVIERAPDPSDGRAQRLRITLRGREAMAHGLGVLGALAAELEPELGRERMARQHDDLLALLAALERRSAATMGP